MMAMHYDFHNDIMLTFLKQYKREFYAYCYGSYAAQKQLGDFYSMLCSGGEL